MNEILALIIPTYCVACIVFKWKAGDYHLQLNDNGTLNRIECKGYKTE